METYMLLMDTENWAAFKDDYNQYNQHIDKKIKFRPPSHEIMFKSNLDKWREWYSISYMAVRHKLKQIAIHNQNKLGIETRLAKDFRSFREDEIYFTTDDDDWFNPNIVDKVVDLFIKYPDVDVVYWPSWQYDTTYVTEKFNLYNPDRLSMGSNGLAIRGKYHSIMGHWGIHELVDKVVPMEKRLYYDTDEVLSIWNIHPASFWQRVNYPLLPDINCLFRCQRPRSMDWAAGEIDEFYNVITSIKPFSECDRDPVHLL